MSSCDLQFKQIPFFMDFAFELPQGVEIESNSQGGDCITWSEAGCDDD